ncbi:hypothetical protein ACFQ9D_09705 [Arthrobacter koreensis]|uniref:hypothetical protein n=1 Tax=Arthrobacter koreensis TaxID=199136 RepID=UPI003626C7AB
MSRTTEVRLRDIRAHEGSQARAWEELAYQLRPSPGPGHIETRKTKAPDAGVEWYDVYGDGHEEGFQAKFHANLEDALGGMLESVKAVAGKRPRMTRLTFVVPYDFTDSGASNSKSDQDRWDDAVTRWKKVEGAATLHFSVIKAGDITDKLTRAEHAGRRAYWFGNLELTDDWLSSRLRESVAIAGERYTPEADTPSAINDFIGATSNSRRFLADLENKVNQTLRACRHDTGMWGTDTDALHGMLESLQKWARRTFEHPVDAVTRELPTRGPDFRALAMITTDLHETARSKLASLAFNDRQNMSRAMASIDSLRDLANGRFASLCTERAVAIEGPAGQGKTHALMAAAEKLLHSGVPTVAILGQRLRDATWWSAFSDALGGLSSTSDEFLQALDSLAEARNCRAVILVDALNESESPRRWRTELPALLSCVREYNNLALIVSFRSDYRDVVLPSGTLPVVPHPGLAGREADALEKYSALFDISVPSHSLFDPSFGNPLFLRMYCEVLARETVGRSEPVTRSNLFERFAEVRSRQVILNLELSPSSDAASKAIGTVADLLLASHGQPAPRDVVEPAVDSFLPGRLWPKTLFQQLCSEGLLELQPTFDGKESVGLPFQAYSEHVLASRLLKAFGPLPEDRWWHRFLRGRRHPKAQLAARLRDEPWLWRAMAVLLPERWGCELTDLIPDEATEFRLRAAMKQSFVERTSAAFGQRALDILKGSFANNDGNEVVDTVLSLAPRVSHPANSDWLHQLLTSLDMPTRDASWSISSYDVETESPAFRRLTAWAARVTAATSDEEVRLAAIALMWLLTSSNRFLRDGVTKTLVQLLSSRLSVAAQLLRTVQDVDDPYVQERVLASIYGAVMVDGDNDLKGVGLVCRALIEWKRSGLPVHVLARDSMRGIVAWAHDRGLAGNETRDAFSPPYGADAPMEPPTIDELHAQHGIVENDAGKIVQWGAFSILSSCLNWHGDFNKYVVKGDVNHFSLHPLSGPAPVQRKRNDPLGEVNADWAGRWIATRVLEMGWTPERFERFERERDLRSGRDSHKPERFGKKYQWIALHELLARLADNYHPSVRPWENYRGSYQGPWPWYGRDIDPSLPPSVFRGNSRFCDIAHQPDGAWAKLPSPDLDTPMMPDDWVARIDDLPNTSAMFAPQDPSGRRWIALQRYSTWDRDNALRTGMTKRERDVFFLQFSWLAPRGQGQALYELLAAKGLNGRWMPDATRTHTRYLGELDWAPIESTAHPERDIPPLLEEAGLEAWPAVEQYSWEGNTLDCSIDENVDFYMPTSELLGGARWVGYRAEWVEGDVVVCRAHHLDDEENGQEVLLADADWLNGRLTALNADLVIGTLSEKHALPIDDDDYRKMAFTDISYLALIRPGQPIDTAGPNLAVRQREH